MKEKKEVHLKKALKNVHKLVYKKYRKKAKWLNQCTIEQLDRGIDLILDSLNYKQYKAEVLKD